MKKVIILNENIGKFYNRLIEITKVENLQYFRIILGIIFLIQTKNLSYLGELPDSFFRPHVLNFTNLFDSWPPSTFFQILYFFTLVLSITIILGIKTRSSFLLIGTIMLIQSGFKYSFGKIDHGILMNILPFIMAFTNSGCKRALFPDKRLKSANLSLSILAIFITFGFFTAGLEKALVWIDFNNNTSGFLSWFYSSYYSVGRDKLLAPYVLSFPWWLTEIMDYSAVIFELTGLIFLLISRKTWLYYLLIASLFHLFNTLFLNISFQIHILVFGIWFVTPFLNRYKILVLIIPLLFYFKGIYFMLFGWILICVLGIILIVEKCKSEIKNTKKQKVKTTST